MLKSLHLLLFLLSSAVLIAQPVSTGNSPVFTIESIPEFTVEGSYYPEFLLNEKFYNYQMGYRISDKLMIDIQSFYSRFGTKERIRVPMLLKARLNKNLYLLAGPEVEYDLTGEAQARTPRLSMNSGIEYRSEDSFYINAIYNHQLNDSNVGPQGNLGVSNMFSLNSGFKF